MKMARISAKNIYDNCITVLSRLLLLFLFFFVSYNHSEVSAAPAPASAPQHLSITLAGDTPALVVSASASASATAAEIGNTPNKLKLPTTGDVTTTTTHNKLPTTTTTASSSLPILTTTYTKKLHLLPATTTTTTTATIATPSATVTKTNYNNKAVKQQKSTKTWLTKKPQKQHYNNYNNNNNKHNATTTIITTTTPAASTNAKLKQMNVNAKSRATTTTSFADVSHAIRAVNKWQKHKQQQEQLLKAKLKMKEEKEEAAAAVTTTTTRATTIGLRPNDDETAATTTTTIMNDKTMTKTPRATTIQPDDNELKSATVAATTTTETEASATRVNNNNMSVLSTTSNIISSSNNDNNNSNKSNRNIEQEVKITTATPSPPTPSTSSPTATTTTTLKLLLSTGADFEGEGVATSANIKSQTDNKNTFDDDAQDVVVAIAESTMVPTTTAKIITEVNDELSTTTERTKIIPEAAETVSSIASPVTLTIADNSKPFKSTTPTTTTVKPLRATTRQITTTKTTIIPLTTTITEEEQQQPDSLLPVHNLGILLDMRGRQQQQQQQDQHKQHEQHAKQIVGSVVKSSSDSKAAIDGNNAATNTAAIKLIDLESNVDFVSSHQRAHFSHSAGHDGVKQTKKKQLIDKHFMFTSTTPSSTKTTATPTTTTTNTPTTSINNKPSTFAPVHNGYLGPIFMEEHTYSHAQHAQTPIQSHVASIESQLRDGRIVEIIAPTALLEDTTTTTTTMPTITTNAVPVSTVRSVTTMTSPTVHRVERIQNTPVLSTTVFQVPDSSTSTTRFPANNKSPPGIQTESKISDIQIEVYDSTVDSIVASTNFRDNEGYYALPLESVMGTTRPPSGGVTQERFTQYVVDRVDSSTEKSSSMPLHAGAGKPEPAAIEIHINVSEGIGSESEDLEFSYPQGDYGKSHGLVNNLALKTKKPVALKTFSAAMGGTKNGTTDVTDEILVVEIIDTGDNITENSASSENMNPIFTFHADGEADLEMKDAVLRTGQNSDELFLADIKQQGGGHYPQPPLLPPPPPRKPSIDRDSDTIFYISNTEVKVGESLPTAHTSYQQEHQQQLQAQQARLESQFFPANYVPSKLVRNNADVDVIESPQAQPPQRYEEDIILSPLRNTADSLKIFRSSSDGAPPLDVTYVGESIMEVEQSSGAGITTTSSAAYAPPSLSSPSQTPDVIIQPAILPEISIGVPVIGELPPQIELKAIDFMPDEANQLRSGIFDNDIDERDGGNDVDRLVESSIQYGGDLIDENARAGFDGVEGSYPFGNPALLRAHKSDADYGHLSLQHGVNNLRKDELSVDVASSGELLALANRAENITLRELLLSRNPNDTNGLASAIANAHQGQPGERMSNATAFSIDEQRNPEGFDFNNVFSLIIGLFVVLLPIVITVSMAFALRYLYSKYRANANNSDNTDEQHVLDKNGDGGENGDDISRDARETKMHYNTSDKDGVFVVEVARGIDSKTVPDSPVGDAKLPDFPVKEHDSAPLKAEEPPVPQNPQQEEVQIHPPPPELSTTTTVDDLQRSLHQIDEVEEPVPSPNSVVERTNTEETALAHNSNTGLSQSDLSSTSSTDSNKRYSYGNQELYVIEQPGYATTSPTAHTTPKAVNANETTDDDRKSENGHSLESGPAQVVNSSPQDIEAEVSTPCKLSQYNDQQQQTINDTNDCQLNGPVEQEAKSENDGVTIEPENETPAVESTTLNGEIAVVTSENDNTEIEDTKEQIVSTETPMAEVNGAHEQSDKSPIVDAEDDEGDETETEQAYDSIMSLPAPPTTEEIKQLDDYSSVDTNQLDSLPPPPPPSSASTLLPVNNHSNSNNITNNNNNNNGEIDMVNASSIKTLSHETYYNGHNGNDEHMSTLPPPTSPLNNRNGKILPAPLTPPASPSPSPSPSPPVTTLTHCSNAGMNAVVNGINGAGGGIPCTPLPLAVDVNGS